MARTTGTRLATSVITEKCPLEEVWPEVASRLAAMLRRRGLQPHTIEDIIQEVAARVLANHVLFGSADDLARWAFTVARNLACDDMRSRRHLAEFPIEDRPAPDEVSTLVEKRVVLEETARAFSQLTDSERGAILSGLTPASTGGRKEDIRLAVRRHRARAHLARLLKGLVGILGGVWAGRRLVNGGSTAGRLVVAASPVVLVVATSVSILALRSDPAPRPEPQGVPPLEELTRRGQPTTTSSPSLAVASPSEPKPPRAQAESTAQGEQQHVPEGTEQRDPDPLSRRVDAETPDGRRVSTGLEPRKEDDQTACVEWQGVLEKTCVDGELQVPPEP